tara:strand:+ start:2648 stop:3751 length:1104 start_codon:yes stop_codon:yes gene_type:complete
MKILVLYLGRKGAGPVYALEMARALRNKNEIVAVLSNYIENKSDWNEISTIKKYYWNTYKNKKQFVFSLFKFKLFYNLIKTIKNEKPNIIYSPMPSLWDVFLFPFLSKYTRIKTIHDVELHRGEDGFINRFFHRQSFKNSEKFIVLSKKYVSLLIEKGIESKNIKVIPHASFSYYDNDSSKDVFNAFSKKILFFGRIEKYKGLNILLDAFKLIKNKEPNAILRIVGSGDVSIYQKKLELLSSDIELHNRWIEDNEVKGFFKDITLLVLPYIHASQSGVIPLAYSLGVPVLAFNVGCISEQLIDNETGILIPVGNGNFLAKAIIDILRKPEKLTKMGFNAKEYSKTKLSWEVSALLLNELINEKGGIC